MAELNQRLLQAIAAARAEKVPQAKLLAESALEEEPEDVNALLLLSALAETQEEQVEYLGQILAYDPDHAVAKKRLAQLKEVPAATSDTPVDALEGDGAEAALVAPTPPESAKIAGAPPQVEAAPTESQEVEAESTADTAMSEPAVAEDEPLPIQEASEPAFERVVELPSTDELTEPAQEEAGEFLEPSFEELETAQPDEIVEPSPVDSQPLEPSFEELEIAQPDEIVEASPVESQPLVREELPAVFARKVEALLPDEMAQSLDEALVGPVSTEETQEPPLENTEPFPYEETTQQDFEAAEAFSVIEDLPEDGPEDNLFEESSASSAGENFESFTENELAAFPEEVSEPYFEDTDPFPAVEEADLHMDDPLATLIADAPETLDETAPERFIDELHDFPVEDLRKPSVLSEEESPTGSHTEAPDLEAAQLFEPLPEEMDDLPAEEAPSEEQPVERPFLAVTAPLRHEVVESPPDAREGLAAQLDEELLEEEDGPDLDALIGRNSPEAGPVLAASMAGLEVQQDDELANEDVFASLVEEANGPDTGNADRVTGFEPVAESDIPEWLREAEDSSLAASIVEDESQTVLQEPAELNDIPAWLLDDGDEEWLESSPGASADPTTFGEESIDTAIAPGVAPEVLVAAPAEVADYSDDDIDAAMATIIDDEVDGDPFVTNSSIEEPAEIHLEDPGDTAEGEELAGKVSTRALEIFLIVLVAVAVIVLAALALVVFNPFS